MKTYAQRDFVNHPQLSAKKKRRFLSGKDPHRMGRTASFNLRRGLDLESYLPIRDPLNNLT
ncbi:hypothetical protein ABQH03_27155 (plasmid) [Citrobacter freundii]|nr:hypothetical protein [Citrobacter freundii]